MPNDSRLLRHFAFMACLAVAVVGCGDRGPTRVAVTGSVKLDGKPVEQGSISFVPPEGSDIPAASAEIKAGEYSLPVTSGPAVGQYRIEIRWSRPTGKKVKMGSPAPPGTMVDEVREAVPAKYNTKSTLEREVSEGDNTLDFDLDS